MSKFNIVFIVMMLMAASAKSTLIPNIAKFRVYVHQYFRGPNANIYEVAQANITASSPTSFGQFLVGDVLITSGPDMNTGKLGQSQGYAVNTGLTESVMLLTGDFVFTEGKYGGSSIILTGRINEEFSILGGTGLFRLARGYAISSTFSSDPNTGYTVGIYDFYVYRN